MPNYLGKLRSFLIIYYRVYAKELIAKVYAKDVKELIIYYYYYYSRSIGRANLRFSGLLSNTRSKRKPKPHPTENGASSSRQRTVKK